MWYYSNFEGKIQRHCTGSVKFILLKLHMDLTSQHSRDILRALNIDVIIALKDTVYSVLSKKSGIQYIVSNSWMYGQLLTFSKTSYHRPN